MSSKSEAGPEIGGSDVKPATGAAGDAEKALESPSAPARKPIERATAASSKPAVAGTPAAPETSRSMLPVIIGAVAILGVFALIAFWPSKSPTSGAEGDKNAAAAGRDGGRQANGSGAKGGVQARDYDEPSAPERAGRRNPAVRLPNVGMSPEAPAPKDDTPPVFTSKSEEIAWYERKLEQANEALSARQKFAERLPKVKEKIEQAPNSAQQLEAFEQRKKIVEDNYAKAQAEVADIEKKLAALRGG